MIFDHRTYRTKPGTIKKQTKLYKENGYQAQVRHLGEPLIYATTETGDVNSYIHIWVYDSAADREIKRAALQADPDWQRYLKMSAEAGHLTEQVNCILTSTDFHTVKR